MTTELIDNGDVPAAAVPKRYPHAAVWLDHFHATIVLASADQQHTLHIDTERDDPRWHRKSGQSGPGRLPEDDELYRRVAEALEANGSPFLVLGPGTAKHDFRRWLVRHRHQLAAKITALETLDHPTDGELAAFVRREFRRLDQLGIE